MTIIRFKDYGKLLFLILFFAFLYTSYKLILPFMPSILSAIILTIIVYPFFQKLKNKTKKETLSALIIIITLMIIIIIPSLFFGSRLVHEAINLHNSVGIWDLHTPSETLKEFTGLNIEFDRYFSQTIKDFSKVFIQSGSEIIKFLATGFIYLFATFFMVFFFLKDGKKLSKEIKKIIPLSNYQKARLFKGTQDIINGIFKGFFVIALLEFIASMIGFTIFGIPNPLLWSLFIAIFAMIPFLGPASIWGPAAIYLLIKGEIISAIILILYFGSILSFYMDGILKNQLIGKKTKITPVVSLLGIFGGIKLFGIIGIVVGPLILSLFILIYKLYREEKDVSS